MEMQHILLFALVGTICMVIVTGGVLSMTSDIEPSTTNLTAGGAVGAAVGAAASLLFPADGSSGIKGLQEMLTSSGVPDMKVGLPSF
jgi:hypothetical protein